MSDFIREVDEEYRRDRVVGFLARYQVLLIGLVVAIIVGTAAYRIYLHVETQAAEAANARYDAAMQLVRDGKSAEAQSAFDVIQKEGPAGYAMLARMKAVEALATRDPAAAARGFDSIAQDSALDPAMRDAAQLRGAMLRVDTEDPKVFEKLYAPLAVPGFAFHSSLRELLAMAAFKRNDTEAAGHWLDEIVIDQMAPSSVRSRAEAFLSLVAAGPAEAGIPEPPKPILEVPAAPATATPADPASPAVPEANKTPEPAPVAPAAVATEPPAAIPASSGEAPADPTAARPPAANPTSPSPAGTPPAR